MKILIDHFSPFLLAHGGAQVQIEQTKWERFPVVAALNPQSDCLKSVAKASIENVFWPDSFTLIGEWIAFRARQDQI